MKKFINKIKSFFKKRETFVADFKATKRNYKHYSRNNLIREIIKKDVMIMNMRVKNARKQQYKKVQ